MQMSGWLCYMQPGWNTVNWQYGRPSQSKTCFSPLNGQITHTTHSLTPPLYGYIDHFTSEELESTNDLTSAPVTEVMAVSKVRSYETAISLSSPYQTRLLLLPFWSRDVSLKFICSKTFVKLSFVMKRVDFHFHFCGIFVCTAILIFICKSSMFTLLSSSGQRLCIPVQISVFFVVVVFLYRYYCSTFVYCFNTCKEGSVHGF